MTCTRKVLTTLALVAVGAFALTAVSQPAWAGCGSCGGGEGHTHAKAANAEATSGGECTKAKDAGECAKDKTAMKAAVGDVVATDAAAGKCAHDGECKKDGSCKADGECKGKGKGMQAARVEAALASVEKAQAALKAGKSDEAAEHLKAAHAKLQETHAAMKKMHQAKAETAEKPAVVNAKCPIMGNKIDAAKVPTNLYRVHNGKGVGFCCGGCPVAWDKLSDAEKAEKLKAAM